MLITEAYRQQQARLHAAGDYGKAGAGFGGVVSDMLVGCGAKSLLDYGCGSRQSLRGALTVRVDYRGYDPAVPEFAAEPEPADCVACIDVLEHIEPECLEAVLDHIRAKTLRAALVSIHIGPALKTLQDGRNAHLIQRDADWWLPLLMRRFVLRTFGRTKGGFVVALSVLN